MNAADWSNHFSQLFEQAYAPINNAAAQRRADNELQKRNQLEWLNWQQREEEQNKAIAARETADRTFRSDMAMKEQLVQAANAAAREAYIQANRKSELELRTMAVSEVLSNPLSTTDPKKVKGLAPDMIYDQLSTEDKAKVDATVLQQAATQDLFLAEQARGKFADEATIRRIYEAPSAAAATAVLSGDAGAGAAGSGGSEIGIGTATGGASTGTGIDGFANTIKPKPEIEEITEPEKAAKQSIMEKGLLPMAFDAVSGYGNYLSNRPGPWYGNIASDALVPFANLLDMPSRLLGGEQAGFVEHLGDMEVRPYQETEPQKFSMKLMGEVRAGKKTHQQAQQEFAQFMQNKAAVNPASTPTAAPASAPVNWNEYWMRNRMRDAARDAAKIPNQPQSSPIPMRSGRVSTPAVPMPVGTSMRSGRVNQPQQPVPMALPVPMAPPAMPRPAAYGLPAVQSAEEEKLARDNAARAAYYNYTKPPMPVQAQAQAAVQPLPQPQPVPAAITAMPRPAAYGTPAIQPPTPPQPYSVPEGNYNFRAAPPKRYGLGPTAPIVTQQAPRSASGDPKIEMLALINSLPPEQQAKYARRKAKLQSEISGLPFYARVDGRGYAADPMYDQNMMREEREFLSLINSLPPQQQAQWAARKAQLESALMPVP